MLDRLDAEELLAREVQELRCRLVHEAPIEQAVGIIVGTRRCCPEEARLLLEAIAEECQADLRDVAVLVVQETTGGVRLDFDRWVSRTGVRTSRADAEEGSAHERLSRATARDAAGEPSPAHGEGDGTVVP